MPTLEYSLPDIKPLKCLLVTKKLVSYSLHQLTLVYYSLKLWYYQTLVYYGTNTFVYGGWTSHRH